MRPKQSLLLESKPTVADSKREGVRLRAGLLSGVRAGLSGLVSVCGLTSLAYDLVSRTPCTVGRAVFWPLTGRGNRNELNSEHMTGHDKKLVAFNGGSLDLHLMLCRGPQFIVLNKFSVRTFSFDNDPLFQTHKNRSAIRDDGANVRA